MCHGHMRYHPCAHSSINWHYCPAAIIDLDTGWETPCSTTSFASGNPSNMNCPLEHCQFIEKGGKWMCCSCQQGPNTRGWCTMPISRVAMNPESLAVEEVEMTCDHGCCENCAKIEPERNPTPDVSFPELQRGSASRKFGSGLGTRSHRRGSAFSLTGQYPGTSGEVSASSSSTSKSSSSSAEYNVDLEYPSKKSKSSKKRGKSRR